MIDKYATTKQYFDFGISTENNGLFLNEGLIAQKEGFGARTIVHSFYELSALATITANAMTTMGGGGVSYLYFRYFFVTTFFYTFTLCCLVFLRLNIAKTKGGFYD